MLDCVAVISASNHKKGEMEHGKCCVSFCVSVSGSFWETQSYQQGWAWVIVPRMDITVPFENESLSSYLYLHHFVVSGLYSAEKIRRKNTSKVVCTIVLYRVVLIEVCGVWNWMVFQTVVLIKLLIQDGCRLRPGMKIILLQSDYLTTKNALTQLWY